MTILLIEDDPGIAELLEEALEGCGYDIVWMCSANDALNWLDAHFPDLMVLDYSLPGMTGKAFIEILRQKEYPLPPFVVATGQGDERIAVDMMKLGARDYIVKDLNFLGMLPEVIKRIEKDIHNEKTLRRTQQALQESEVRFNAFMENLPAAVFIQDVEGRPVYVNPYIKRTFHGDKWPGKAADRQNVIRDGHHVNIDHVLEKDGNPRLYETHTFPIQQPDGSSLLGAIALDMTERVCAEEEIRTLNATLEKRVADRTTQLEAINRELKEFAYIVSHDLKAPLRGVNQLSNWIAQDYAELLDEEGNKLLKLLNGRVRRMAQLIDGILQYSRIDRVQGEKQALDLQSLVRDVIDLLAPPAHIHVTVETDLPVIWGDATRMTQIFQNIIGNAIKYSDKSQGLVTVGCAELEHVWQLRVADNGPGVEKKDYERIFKIFQTGGRREENESTGIGLTVVKKIVEMYGGRVWVESEVGVGSTFFLTLPKESGVRTLLKS